MYLQIHCTRNCEFIRRKIKLKSIYNNQINCALLWVFSNKNLIKFLFASANKFTVTGANEFANTF
jgi:hypothetical protein